MVAMAVLVRLVRVGWVRILYFQLLQQKAVAVAVLADGQVMDKMVVREEEVTQQMIQLQVVMVVLVRLDKGMQVDMEQGLQVVVEGVLQKSVRMQVEKTQMVLLLLEMAAMEWLMTLFWKVQTFGMVVAVVEHILTMVQEKNTRGSVDRAVEAQVIITEQELREHRILVAVVAVVDGRVELIRVDMVVPE